ncbi:TRAP transporter small permease [Chrysiogenes arsenatis]|uniref:TRAP transporter small permease n=1 Tax=Chrysiogenes arsenatis TaxID=309797 RepID=UPI00041F8BD5|nr:TRAP transporter small permease [Chrysiogenes arsenatis]
MTYEDIRISWLATLGRVASTLLDLVTKICFHLSAWSLALIVIIILKEVVMRYFFNAPSSWATDVNTWLLALSIMLALPEITRTNGNVAITVIVDKLGSSKQMIMRRSVAFLGCVVCLVVCYIASLETIRQYDLGIATLWVSPIPKWWISSVIPVGFFLTAVHFLRQGIRPGTQ